MPCTNAVIIKIGQRRAKLLKVSAVRIVLTADNATLHELHFQKTQDCTHGLRFNNFRIYCHGSRYSYHYKRGLSSSFFTSIAVLFLCLKMIQLNSLVVASFVLGLLPMAFSKPAKPSKKPSCRCLPSEAQWPTIKEWDTLNKTVGGRLLKTVSLAEHCYEPTYDASRCEAVSSGWAFTDTQFVPHV